jgi:hypothetical protein
MDHYGPALPVGLGALNIGLVTARQRIDAIGF